MLKKKHEVALIIGALWFLMFSASSQLMIISPILPILGKELLIPEPMLGTLVSAYAVMLSVFALIAGPISDRIGRRRILMVGTGCMTAALLLHNFAFDYYSMLTVRAIAGAAGGMLSGASVSYVGDYFPYERRGWANGIVSTGIAAGQIAGIPLGTLLADWIGFRGPFSLFAGTMFIAFFMIWLFVPQPSVELQKERFTLVNVLRKYLGLLRQAAIASTAAAFAVMFFGISMFIVYFPTWLSQTLNFTLTEIAGMFLAGGLATVVAGPLAGTISDKIGRKLLILASCAGLAVLTLLIPMIVTSAWIAYAVFALMMVFVAARMSPFQALISELIPAHQRGSMMSLTIALGQGGMGLGGMWAGIIYTDMGFSMNTIIAAASIITMGILVWFFIPELELKTASTSSE